MYQQRMRNRLIALAGEMLGGKSGPNHHTNPKPFLGLGFVIFLVFGLAHWAPFAYDDLAFIFQNTDVVGPWAGWRKFWLDPYISREAYEPVIMALHRGLYALVGTNIFWYRVTSLLLHWANCVLLLLLFRELVEPPEAAFLLAAVFAVYPAHTEVLAISTFKKHLIVAFCALLMLHLEKPWRTEKSSRAARAACFLLLGVAVMTKEHGLLLPPITLAMSLLLAKDWKERLRRDTAFYLGLFCLCGVFIWWRSVVVPRPATNVIGDDLMLHWLTSAKCLLWYARELAFPWQLCQEHSIAPVTAVLSWDALGVVGGVAACALLAAAVWRRDRTAFAGLILTLLWLAPFLNVFPYLNFSLVANRYLYLASAGVILCLARLTSRAWAIRFHGMPAAALAWIAVGLAYSGVAMRNLSRYSDPLELWTCAADCAPTNPRAHALAGNALAAALRYDEAEREFRAASRLAHGLAPSFTIDLATTLAMRGDFRRAGLIADSLSRHHPCAVDLRTERLLGICALKQGKNEKAFSALKLALRFDLYDGVSWLNLGLYYLRTGQHRRAETAWLAAKGLPDYRPLALKYLAQLYAMDGRLDLARKAYQDCLSDEPLQLDAVSGLAQLYSRSGQAAKGRVLFDDLIKKLDHHRATMVAVINTVTPQQERFSQNAVTAARRARAEFLKSMRNNEQPRSVGGRL